MDLDFCDWCVSENPLSYNRRNTVYALMGVNLEPNSCLEDRTSLPGVWFLAHGNVTLQVKVLEFSQSISRPEIRVLMISLDNWRC